MFVEIEVQVADAQWFQQLLQHQPRLQAGELPEKVFVAQGFYASLPVHQWQHPLHLGFGHLAHIVENGHHSD